jgi:hypothetical protein
MSLFIGYNCAGPGATTQTNVATGGVAYTTTGSRMMIQVDIPATLQLRLVEWGISFNGSAAATPNTVELAQVVTGTTVTTAYTSSTLLNIGCPNGPASKVTLATSGFYSAAVTRTSTTVTRVFDSQFVAPTNQYVKMWPLGREPIVDVSSKLQLSMNLQAAVTALAYIVWEEL